MDLHDFAYALPTINNLSTILAIACVLPTYFLWLRPPTYRLILSLGIAFGLSTLVLAITTTFFPLPHKFIAFWVPFEIVVFSPLVIVLIAILAGIKWVTRVGLWSTVVLVCVAADWAGIYVLIFALS